jgi:large subunit ribosomal protein L9
VKVVFLETVEGSGDMGDVKDVANGYARNFLLPRGLAAPATPAVLAKAERLREVEAQRQRDQDERARQLVGRLESKPLAIGVRVGEQGRLYGSVNNADIAEKAGEILGEELDRRIILLPEAIRSVGVYTVPIRLSRNVVPEVTVVVVDVEAPQGVEAAAQALLDARAAEALRAEQAQTPPAAAVEEASSADADAAGVPEPGSSEEDESEEVEER